MELLPYLALDVPIFILLGEADWKSGWFAMGAGRKATRSLSMLDSHSGIKFLMVNIERVKLIDQNTRKLL